MGIALQGPRRRDAFPTNGRILLQRRRFALFWRPGQAVPTRWRAYGGPPGARLRASAPDNQRDLRGPPSLQIICFTCYKVGDYIAPDCDMKMKDVSLVPHQYEKLTTAQKGRVPPDAYLRAVALLSYEANRVINPVATVDPPPRLGTGTKTPLPSEGVRQPPKTRRTSGRSS